MEYIIMTICLLIISLSLFALYKKQLAKLKKEYIDKENILKEQNNKLEEEKRLFKEEQESITQSICEEVKQLDEELTKKVSEIQAKNTVQFECPCEHQTIVMELNLAGGKEDNTYVCPECGNEYYVNVSLIPTIKEKIINEQAMYNLLSEKYNTLRINE